MSLLTLNRSVLYLVLLLALATLSLGQDRKDGKDKEGRVRAKEPTVVNVQGKQQKVEEQRGFGSRVSAGFSRVWQGAMSWIDDSLGLNDENKGTAKPNETKKTQ
jgi:hypothetical protein